jgi:hypothetical protein
MFREIAVVALIVVAVVGLRSCTTIAPSASEQETDDSEWVELFKQGLKQYSAPPIEFADDLLPSGDK